MKLLHIGGADADRGIWRYQTQPGRAPLVHAYGLTKMPCPDVAFTDVGVKEALCALSAWRSLARSGLLSSLDNHSR